MTDRPILFSAPMVRALLASRKTQTRRLATSKPTARIAVGDRLWVRESIVAEELSRPPRQAQLGAKGRRISGRTHAVVLDEMDGVDGVRYLADELWQGIENTFEAGEQWSTLFHYGYKAGKRPCGLRGKGVPSIHMPRWASRLTLTVTETRTQRLGAITEADARAEGIEQQRGRDGTSWFLDPQGDTCAFASSAYASLWNSLHTADGTRWEDSPEIIAITFTVAIRNIDA